MLILSISYYFWLLKTIKLDDGPIHFLFGVNYAIYTYIILLDPSKCKAEEFKCPNGKCIYKYVLCDGRKDCNDGSDESASMCKVRIIYI